MWTKRLTLFLLFILMAVPCRVWLTAAAQPLHQPVVQPASLLPFLATQVYADFDQDRLPDLARVSSNGELKSIQVAFGNTQTSQLYFKAPTGTVGHLFAADIDRDHDDDLIWLPHQQFGKAIIWLGNGRGQFERVGDPEPYQTELVRLCGSEKNAELSLALASPLLAVAAQYQYAAAEANLHSCFPSTTLVRGADNPICHALEPSISYLRKRGPPPSAA